MTALASRKVVATEITFEIDPDRAGQMTGFEASAAIAAVEIPADIDKYRSIRKT